MSPAVSIIIPTWNGKALLKNCLASITRHVHTSFEIIVIDNGSTDGTGDYLARYYPQVQVVRLSKNEGFCRPNNIGVERARSPYILFLNNDTVAHSDFVSPLVEYLERHPEVGLVQPKLYLNPDKKTLDATGSFFTPTGFLRHRGYRETDRGQYDQIEPILSPKGAAMLTRRALFKKVGGFDEEFFAYNEETDLAWRIWLTGKTVLFFPRVSLEHVGGSTEKAIDFNYIQFQSFKNRIRMFVKNMELLTLLRVLPVHLFLLGGLVVMLLVTGRVRKAMTIVHTVAWNVLHFPSNLKARSDVARFRTLRDREFLPALTRSPEMRRSLISMAWFVDRKKWDQR